MPQGLRRDTFDRPGGGPTECGTRQAVTAVAVWATLATLSLAFARG